MAGVGSSAGDCTTDDLLAVAVVNFGGPKFISRGKTGGGILTGGGPWGT